ncbi:DUF2155 domain-containing protein [Rubellimicrobium arenae]|uniref:DUF2155 domain-containing protein n=1 Tax=Rubellimicrobium arenae TaxID=2817372 RepID=UPI0034A2789E
MLAAVLFAAPVAAQDSLSIVPPSRGQEPSERIQAPSGAAASAVGGIVRVLDKINGTTSDLQLRNGETADIGALTVTMGDCRYPTDNPAGDAYILLSIRTKQDDAAVFEGWMVASAPALSALDHPRYDVWALRCIGVD